MLRIEFQPSAAAPAGSPFALVSDVNRAMNWGLAAYPLLFSSRPSSGAYLQYAYRYYRATGNYLGIADGRVYVHNGREWNFLDVGTLSAFMPLAVSAGY